MGAGILPIAIHNRKVYLLIGKEHDEKKWSDFGGSTEYNETAFNTALATQCSKILYLLSSVLLVSGMT